MKVVILAGGFGTRLSEYTDSIPKPMVEVGGKPIIWHVMNIYAEYGYKDFVIALGYKAEVIKNYFANYHIGQNDFTVNLANGNLNQHDSKVLDWNVTLVDTGLHTMTGGRVKRLKDFLDDTFLLTYGDGVADVEIDKLVEFHKKSSNPLTLTAVRPTARFGELEISESNKIVSFEEKPQMHSGWINGGFFVCEKEVLDLIEGDHEMFEREPMQRIITKKGISAYKHKGFWKCMDTVRDREVLKDIYKKNKFKF